MNFPLLAVASKEESGSFKIVGEPSRGRMSSTKGGPVVPFEAAQLTVNDPHCVGCEYDGVKATVATRDEKRARQWKNMRLQLGTGKASMSHGGTGDQGTPESQLWAVVEKAQRGAVWRPERSAPGRQGGVNVSR